MLWACVSFACLRLGLLCLLYHAVLRLVFSSLFVAWYISSSDAWDFLQKIRCPLEHDLKEIVRLFKRTVLRGAFFEGTSFLCFLLVGYC